MEDIEVIPLLIRAESVEVGLQTTKDMNEVGMFHPAITGTITLELRVEMFPQAITENLEMVPQTIEDTKADMNPLATAGTGEV